MADPFCVLDKSVHVKNLAIDSGLVQSTTDFELESLSFSGYNSKFINPAYKTLIFSKILSGSGTLLNHGTVILKDTFSFEQVCLYFYL